MVITGKVVKSCDDHTPVPGVNIEIKMHEIYPLCGKEKYSAITNEEGNFTLVFNKNKLCGGASNWYLHISTDSSSLGTLGHLYESRATDLNDVVIYLNHRINHTYVIKTPNTSYSEKDTLFLPLGMNVRGELQFKATTGPFTDGQIVETKVMQGAQMHAPGCDFLLTGSLHWDFKTEDGQVTRIFTHPTTCYGCEKPNMIYVELT